MKRKQHSTEFKVKVAIDALKGLKTINELSTEYGLHATQITSWKKQALDGLPDIFSTRRKKAEKSQDDLTDELYQQIGRLKMELDWLKKKAGLVGER